MQAYATNELVIFKYLFLLIFLSSTSLQISKMSDFRKLLDIDSKLLENPDVQIVPID